MAVDYLIKLKKKNGEKFCGSDAIALHFLFLPASGRTTACKRSLRYGTILSLVNGTYDKPLNFESFWFILQLPELVKFEWGTIIIETNGNKNSGSAYLRQFENF